MQNILLSGCLGLLGLLGYVWMKRKRVKQDDKLHVAVIVLGNLGLSPRMQQHALALRQYYTKQKVSVYLIGYTGTSCREELEENSDIAIYRLSPPLLDSYKCCWLFQLSPMGKTLLAMVKVLGQAFKLFWVLLTLPSIQCVIVQNPPAIPTLPLLVLLRYFLHYGLIVDWHNYGYSLLTFPGLVTIYQWCEKFFGQQADRAFCVSNAMKEELIRNKWISDSRFVEVLYDRPTRCYSLCPEEKHKFYSQYFPGMLPSGSGKKTFLLQSSEAVTSWFSLSPDKVRSLRPVLIVTGTSWTPDEDLFLLLEVLKQYDQFAQCNSLPNLVIAITGKGKMREEWLKKAEETSWSKVYIVTGYLPYSDYLKLLCVADLGICLHTSSSGVDLPMKVVDMRAAQLPVLAASFPALSELITPGQTGDVFHTKDDLFEKLVYYVSGFFDEKSSLKALKKKSQNNGFDKLWIQTWSEVAGPVVDQLLGIPSKL